MGGVSARDAAGRRPWGAEAVEHAAEKLRRDIDSASSAARHDAVAEREAVGFFERHREDAAVAEADDLGADGAAVARPDFAEIADGGGGSAGFDDESDQFDDFAFVAHGLHAIDDRGVAGEIEFEVGRGCHDCIRREWRGGRLAHG